MSKPHSRKPSKIRPVPIAQMRIPPALVVQREFRKAHADKIIAEFDFDKFGFPVVNFRDGVYWVFDGQHRVHALKQLGFDGPKDTIDCEVFDGLSDQEMADMFLGRSNVRNISPYDKFHIACTAGRKRETDVRRTVESNGIKIGRTKDENTVGAIGALCKVYDQSGPTVLGQVARTLKNAFAGDPSAFTPELIQGVGLVFNRYNGRTHEKELASRLAATPYGVRGLLRRVETQRERTGNQKAQCVAATIVDIYNKGLGPRSQDRLPPWWKDMEADV